MYNKLSNNSHQIHQRALKNVLIITGALKIEDNDIAEELTLMRRLRDMNIPKFVFEDFPLFIGLIKDLSPGMEVKRKPYENKEIIIEIMRGLVLFTDLLK